MQQLHEFLRYETGAIHAEVESHLNASRILSPDFTLSEYLSHLQTLHQAHRRLEHSLAPLENELLILQFNLPKPTLSSLLGQDLITASQIPKPPTTEAPLFNTVHHAIGALYVIYGSSLGRNMIRRSLEPLLQSWNLDNAAYYGTKNDFMADWQRFCTTLAKINPSPTERQSMKDGALNAFRAFLIESNFSTCSNPTSSPKPSPHP